MYENEQDPWTIAEGIRKAKKHLKSATHMHESRMAIAKKILEQLRLSGVRLTRVSKWNDHPGD